MSVIEPTRAQLLTAEALALRWTSVRVEPTPNEHGDLEVQVTSKPPEEKCGGYTAGLPRSYTMLIAPDGEILSGVLS